MPFPTRSRRALFSGSPFDPRNFPGLAIWLDAQDLSTLTFNSTTISSWRNKGVRGAGPAAQGTATNQPLYVPAAINGRPALQFRHDGTNNSWIALTDHPAFDWATLSAFMVAQRVVDSGADEELLYKTAGNPNLEFEIRIHSTDILLGTYSINGTTNPSYQRNGTLAVGTPYLFDTYCSGTEAFAGVNGLLGNGTALSGSLNNNTVNFTVGANTGGGSGFRGHVGEVLVYNGALNLTQRLSVIEGLAQKWGIKL